MLIIFGTRPRFTTLSTGQFFCPHCQTRRAYELRAGRNWFTLYFIPLIPLNSIGEVVTCSTCGMNFSKDVLSMPPSTATPLDRMTSDARQDMDSGTPIEFVRQKLINTGLKIDLVDQTIAAAAGPDRRTCPACSLTYRATVGRCARCGAQLQPLV
jgi:hypothetical protein